VTRKEEEQIVFEDGARNQWRGKRGPKKYSYVPKKDIRANIPLDRASFDQRLEYGLSLMALSQEGVYE
jgi:hypothetical protein